jgi:predicted nucleotidyltransferase component of viral defense system
MLNKRSDPVLWDDVLEKAERMAVQSKRAFQEEVQRAVLAALSQRWSFNSIVLQGGTALRLFHGNPRLSDDIGLVLREGEDHYDLSGSMSSVERFVADTFPFLHSVDSRTSKHDADLQRYVLRTRSDVPEQSLRLHIELAPVPSYRNQPRILEFPPIQPAVRVEDQVEILADKVCALAFRAYLKGRDLWDIHYLTTEKAVGLQWDLVFRKTEDYRKPSPELGDRLETVEARIREEGSVILNTELIRFLPRYVLDQYRQSLDDVLESVLQLISEAGREENAHEGG